ncbi:hypothetical protein BTJ40_00810 [Microbulbifer sp. A4B17]|nr:hypothetical protein BTJ40_00810 [Microbulbifer sp. A4B17]
MDRHLPLSNAKVDRAVMQLKKFNKLGGAYPASLIIAALGQCSVMRKWVSLNLWYPGGSKEDRNLTLMYDVQIRLVC